MSATDIIKELPKLSEADRRLVRERLIELGAREKEIEACDQAALEGALMLDQMEDEDARNQSR